MFKKFNLFAIFAILLMFASSCTEEDSSNTVTDIDGNVYQTVKIGTLTWMVENLKTTKYNDGTSIPLFTYGTAWTSFSTPGYCFYNNDTTNKSIYGALYNWYTVNTGILAPSGWHVATDVEWTTLENYLITNSYNYDGTTAGSKIAKSLASISGWQTSTTIGAVGNDSTKNNISGFTGLPGGIRGPYGDFCYIGVYGSWWSSTRGNALSAWMRSLYYDDSSIFCTEDDKRTFFSVRCVKDY